MNLKDINKLIKMYDNVVLNCDRLIELMTQTEIIIYGKKQNDLFIKLIESIRDITIDTLKNGQ